MKELHILYPKDPVLGKCNECGELGSMNRSRSRNSFERVIKKATPFKIYKCNKCGWRGYRSTIRFTKNSLTTLLIYLGMAAVTVLLIRFVISKFL